MSDDSNAPLDEHLDLELAHQFTLDVDVESPIEIGETPEGRRRIIPIVGGSVSGRIEGDVLPAGADYQLFRIDRPTRLVAQYALETDDGDRVFVENRGIRVAPESVKERIRDGQAVSPGDVYFCTVPQFETAAPDLAWLHDRVFVATGIRRPTGVRLAVYSVE